MATAPLRPNPFEKPENEITPELELPEEDTESVIIHDDMDSESYLSEEEDNDELTPEQLIEQLNSGIPHLELFEEEEVLGTDPGLQAEIDNNPQPDLFTPTPWNFHDELSDEETVVLDSENQPEFLSGYESEDDYDSDDSGSPMTAPAA
jgi:hypothetical protein